MTRLRIAAGAALGITLALADASAEPARLELSRMSGLPNAVLLDEDVAGGGVPSAETLNEASAQGVRTVVDLRLPAEGLKAEQAAARELGMTYVNIPVTPETLSRQQADALADAVGDPADRPALVFCSSGNRVGGLWAVYERFHRGRTAEEAFARGLERGMRSEAVKATVRALVRE
ncbi:MAG TPA: sulfur transferase domain-containing protein [bacterium]